MADHDAFTAVDEAVVLLRCRIGEAIAAASMPTGNAPTLGQMIKTRRASLSMSLDDVARAAGCTKSHIWEMEQDRSRNPTVAMVYGLSQALAVPFAMMASAALATVLKSDRPADMSDDEWEEFIRRRGPQGNQPRPCA